MKKLDQTMAQQVARAISVFQTHFSRVPSTYCERRSNASPGSRWVKRPRKWRRQPAPSCMHSRPAQWCRCSGSPAESLRRPGTGVWTKESVTENGGSTMLVLSRKNQESVVVGGSVGFPSLLKVKVLGIQGTNVRLGFEVDADVPVHRSEVWERIKGDGQAESLTRGPPPPAE